MPVTKTAKRALRSSKRKLSVNNLFRKRLDMAVRTAKKSKTKDKILAAISLADKAAVKKLIHKNKSARIKRSLSKLKTTSPKKTKKVTK